MSKTFEKLLEDYADALILRDYDAADKARTAITAYVEGKESELREVRKAFADSCSDFETLAEAHTALEKKVGAMTKDELEAIRQHTRALKEHTQQLRNWTKLPAASIKRLEAQR